MDSPIEPTDLGKFLLKLKQKNGIKSDLAFARFLGIPQPTIFRLIYQGGMPNDETCLKIANVTGTDPLYIIALAHKSASKLPAVTKAWNQILKKVAPLAAAGFFFFSPFEGVPDTMAALRQDNGSISYQTLIITILALWLTLRPKFQRFSLLAALAALTACGGPISAQEATPPEITYSPEYSAYLQRVFDSTQDCAEIPLGTFEELAITIEPPIFDCDAPNGGCGGQFRPPNLIRLGSPYTYSHELIHYFLFQSTGDPDPEHRSDLFKRCG